MNPADYSELRLLQEIRFLQSSMREADLRYAQRFDAQNEALVKSEIAAEKRFASVNEFRGQLSDMINTLIPRIEVVGRLDSLSARITSLQERMDKLEGSRQGIVSSWVYLVGFIGAVATVLGIASFFLK